MDTDQSRQRFHYLADPVFVIALVLYPINRFYLKPHHIGGWFTHSYFNDVLCLPMFVPIILYAQRLFGIRRHDAYPLAWEIAQHWLVFTVLFQFILPRFPSHFHVAGDRLDILAYFAGGMIAGCYWHWSALARANCR